MSEAANKLKRSISLPLLILYGLGTMIGGGIYALTGEVTGVSGMYAPLSFAIAALLALITAFSFVELSNRFPFSAGEVRYVDAAFNRKNFSALIGWLIVFTGVVSAAALAHATAGFILDFLDLPLLPIAVLIVLALGLVAAWGITQSAALVAVITLIEISGLLLIIYIGHEDLMTLPVRWHEVIPTDTNLYNLAVWTSIFSGAFLAFYAFIGFEDMVNVAEEVKEVRRTMPLAIIVCMVLTLVIYVLVSLVAVLNVQPAILAESRTPMATILSYNDTYISPYIMGIISLLATVNGVLVQIIMGSRVLYGMAEGRSTISWFNVVNSKTQTPMRATMFIVLMVVILVIASDLGTLAKIASGIILFVFAAVNAALLKLKLIHKEKETDVFTVPLILPLAGLITCSAMLVFALWSAFASS